MHEWRSTKYPGADQRAQDEPEPRAAPNGADDPGRHPDDRGPGAGDDRRERPRGKPKGDPRFKGIISCADFMRSMQPPSYVIDGLLQRGCTYTLTGPTGHAKTAVALLMTACLCRGEQFCGRPARKGSVLFLAGENPQNVKVQWYGLCADLGIDRFLQPVFWHEGPFSLAAVEGRLKVAASEIPDLVCTFTDTLQAFFDGDNESDNVQMLEASQTFRNLIETHPNRPTGITMAHPGKYARRDNLLPRGGSSLLADMDGNLTIWRDETVATMNWQGKYRGAPFDPFKLEIVRTEPEGLLDAEGRRMPCTIARPMPTLREIELNAERNSREDRALDCIKAQPDITVRELGTRLGCGQTSAQRAVEALRDDLKWIKKKGREYVLTAEGDEALRR